MPWQVYPGDRHRFHSWGQVTFGQENLPVRVHGDRHVAVEDTEPAAPPRRLVTQPVRRLDLVSAGPATAADDDHGVSPDTPHDNQGAAACCRGPSVESGAQGGDGTGDGRTDEPISGMVQFRTVSESGRHDSNVRPLRPERSALARLSYAPKCAASRTWERPEDYPGPRCRTMPHRTTAEQPRFFAAAAAWHDRSLHRHALGEVPRLIHVAAAVHRDVVGEEL
jgi:hypothetical protein